MTKYAIISDIHANIDALNLILQDAEKRGVDKFICLGDLVVKYFYPAEVVDAIRSVDALTVKGNCDHFVTTIEKYAFARSKLGLDRLEYLENLPIREQIMINKVLVNLYHATPESITNMFNPYTSTNNYAGGVERDYKHMFIGDEPQINFNGHTHREYIGVEKDDQFVLRSPNEIYLSNKDRAIVNVGSVGEHDQLYVNGYDDVKKVIDPFITYAVMDDNGLEEGTVHVQVVSIPYRETLKHVYFDMVDKQKTKEFPNSPNDTKKVHDSLIDMGYTEQDLGGHRL